MGEKSIERARRFKGEREYVAQAAEWWNHEAAMQQYAGWRDPERAYSLGALLGDLSIQWSDLPDRTREIVLHAARGLLGQR